MCNFRVSKRSRKFRAISAAGARQAVAATVSHAMQSLRGWFIGAQGLDSQETQTTGSSSIQKQPFDPGVSPSSSKEMQSAGKSSIRNQSPYPGQATSNDNGCHIELDNTALNSLFILFAVKGTRKTIDLVNIDTKNHASDRRLFEELKIEYKKTRGFWRYWLSVWRLHHCDFVKVA